jgi:hydrogenase maturation protease
MTVSSPIAAESSSRATDGALTPARAGECRIWVVGLGTPAGDDRAGWAVVERLRGAVPDDARADTTSDPLRVLYSPTGCETLIVIDSCRGAGRPGTVHRFLWPDPRLIVTSGVSSHGVGLAAALELASTLGQLPPRVVVFAVEGRAADPGTELSREVEAALPGVVAQVLSEVAAETAEAPRRP